MNFVEESDIVTASPDRLAATHCSLSWMYNHLIIFINLYLYIGLLCNYRIFPRRKDIPMINRKDWEDYLVRLYFGNGYDLLLACISNHCIVGM